MISIYWGDQIKIANSSAAHGCLIALLFVDGDPRQYEYRVRILEIE